MFSDGVTLAFCLLLGTLPFTNAACQKDACYKAVANNGAGKSNLASRRADCQAVFRTVVEDATSILNVLQTVTTGTTTITTYTATITTTLQYTVTQTIQGRDIIPEQAVEARGKVRFPANNMICCVC